jgi:DMSO/TMAO reductase YedYZ heme-binding membrane subunit
MLLLDRNKPTTPLSLVVPGLMDYRPIWTAFGVVAFEVMILIHLSFRYRMKIGPKNWRRLHWATYGVFAGATTHGLMSGSDSELPWAMALYATAASSVVGLTAWRVLSARASAAPRRKIVTTPPTTERPSIPPDKTPNLKGRTT